VSSGPEAVCDAYTTRWGEASRRAVFRTGADEMTVLKWDAAANGEGVDLYATLGASAEDMPGAEPGHRVEYFVGLLPGRDEIASAVPALGLFARREGVLVDHGHTIPADGPLWPGTVMKTFLVLRQISDVLPALSLPGQLHVDFLQAVPVFESERLFKVVNGTEALLRRWEQTGTPFWDPARRDGRPDG
jgi:hypothetical protein